MLIKVTLTYFVWYAYSVSIFSFSLIRKIYKTIKHLFKNRDNLQKYYEWRKSNKIFPQNNNNDNPIVIKYATKKWEIEQTNLLNISRYYSSHHQQINDDQRKVFIVLTINAYLT